MRGQGTPWAPFCRGCCRVRAWRSHLTPATDKPETRKRERRYRLDWRSRPLAEPSGGASREQPPLHRSSPQRQSLGVPRRPGTLSLERSAETRHDGCAGPARSPPGGSRLPICRGLDRSIRLAHPIIYHPVLRSCYKAGVVHHSPRRRSPVALARAARESQTPARG